MFLLIMLELPTRLVNFYFMKTGKELCGKSHGLYVARKHSSFGGASLRNLGVNFTGTLNLCKALFPLLRPHGR